MKTIGIHTESWHYRLLDKMDLMPYAADDFCHYLRKCIGCAVLLMLGFSVGALLTGSTGELLAWLVWMIVNQQLISPDGFVVPAVVAWSISGLAAGYLYALVVKEKLTPSQQEFLDSAWESFHSKVCFRVNFKETA